MHLTKEEEEALVKLLARCNATTTRATHACNGRGNRGTKTAMAKERAAYQAVFKFMAGRKMTDAEVEDVIA